MPTARSTDFARYLPLVPGSEPWGLAVTAGGAIRSARGSSYPPRKHPADHAFTWEHGRVLDAWQVIFIRRGKGRFESQATGSLAVSAGDALVVFPGVWHRYAPDPATGWDELWVELQGSTLARLTATGALLPAQARVALRTPRAVAETFTALHRRLREPHAGFDAVAAALGLQLLARLHETSRAPLQNQPIDLAVHHAEQRLALDLGQPCPIPALAADLGFAYSYFRRAFKERIGLSPHDYRLRLRLDRARRLLGTTNHTLEVIAESLGFSSAYHLSGAFKKVYGLSPRLWRQRSRA